MLNMIHLGFNNVDIWQSKEGGGGGVSDPISFSSLNTGFGNILIVCYLYIVQSMFLQYWV